MFIKTHLISAMNQKYLILPVVIFSALLGYSLLANAISKDDIVFPVAELNNCASESECRAYCDNPDNISACVAFAEKYGLMSGEEIEKAKKFIRLGSGPGGCNSKESCEVYCGDVVNIEVCIKFAEENDLIPHQEVQEAKKVAKILREGKKLPGDCRGKAQCESYCQNPDHAEECLAFGEEAGLMEPEELARAKKFIPLMKKGETPGGCKNKEQCESYCMEGDEHIDECADFALKIGAATKEEMEMFKKTKGRGPGGCKGRQECEAFCNNPDNQDICFKFAEEHGFMKKEDIERMKEQMGQFRVELNRFPPEVLECIKSRAGTEIIDKIRNGTLTPGPEIGRHIQACFDNFRPQMDQMRQGLDQGMQQGIEGQFMGPGGCKTREECIKYCSDPAHIKECGNLTSPQGEYPTPLPPEYQHPDQYPISNCPTDSYWDSNSKTCKPTGPYPQPDQCPTGFYWNGQQCTDAGKECTERGGLWDSNSNTCAEKTAPVGCIEDQVYWQGSCWDPNSEKYQALVCGEKGGTWSWERHVCEIGTYSQSSYYQQSSYYPDTTLPQGLGPQKNKYMANILWFMIRLLKPGI